MWNFGGVYQETHMELCPILTFQKRKDPLHKFNSYDSFGQLTSFQFWLRNKETSSKITLLQKLECCFWLVGFWKASLWREKTQPFVESLERGTSPFQPVPWVVVPGLLPLRRDRCRGCCHLLHELKDQWKGRELDWGKWWKNGETIWNFQINRTIKHQYSPIKMNWTMSFQDPASPPNIWHNWKRG